MFRRTTKPTATSKGGTERSSTSTAATVNTTISRTESTDTADTGATTSSSQPKYYQLDVANLPDKLFHAYVPVEKWLDTCTTTSDASGFPPNSLNQIHPIPWAVEFERIVGFTLYQLLNVLPFLPVPLSVLYWGIATPLSKTAVHCFLVYTGTLMFFAALMEPVFLYRYRQKRFLLASMEQVKRNQYVYTERNTTKYLSVKFVWPASIQRPALEDTPAIFCIVPHGVVSWGIAAYPLWSKVWNSRLCRWSIAPIVLKIPLVNYVARKVGYIPAKSEPILETLTKRNENVGLVLDGIAGMFSATSPNVETAFLKQRKGVVKIALKAGVPIVPVYGFGHTSLYTVCVDPMGLLEYISRVLQVSLTPFLGRWNWILGPPKRVPVTVCLGQPIHCPQVDNPSQPQIDHYHAQLLDSYKELFETHKEAYGWGHKTLRFV